jgi:aryl-alcohol dehydrogenase-like predicted oxidoreductase
MKILVDLFFINAELSQNVNRKYDGAIFELAGSLKRLQTDHLDLHQVQGVSAKEHIKLGDKQDGLMGWLTTFYRSDNSKHIR